MHEEIRLLEYSPELESHILDEVKRRMRIEEQLSEPLEACLKCFIKEITFRLCHYLNITYIPNMLAPTIAAMTCDVARNEGVSFDGSSSLPPIEGVRLGDASFEFKGNGIISQDSFENVVRAYKQDLHAYRRMSW